METNLAVAEASTEERKKAGAVPCPRRGGREAVGDDTRCRDVTRCITSVSVLQCFINMINSSPFSCRVFTQTRSRLDAEAGAGWAGAGRARGPPGRRPVRRAPSLDSAPERRRPRRHSVTTRTIEQHARQSRGRASRLAQSRSLNSHSRRHAGRPTPRPRTRHARCPSHDSSELIQHRRTLSALRRHARCHAPRHHSRAARVSAVHKRGPAAICSNTVTARSWALTQPSVGEGEQVVDIPAERAFPWPPTTPVDTGTPSLAPIRG